MISIISYLHEIFLLRGVFRRKGANLASRSRGKNGPVPISSARSKNPRINSDILAFLDA